MWIPDKVVYKLNVNANDWKANKKALIIVWYAKK
jgi:hypothetical protein